MIRKLTLAAGFAAGYVLGAKAGTQRYDQIMAKARELMGQPAVQDFTSGVTAQASSVADKAKETVNDKVSAVSDKVGSSSSSSSTTTPAVVDLGSGAATTEPVLGASASATAPDVI